MPQEKEGLGGKLELIMLYVKKYIRVLGLLVCSLTVLGCATRGYIPPSGKIRRPPGVYHRVKEGETLWRIAKTYQVGLEEIVKVNRLPDAAKIEIGQLIFVPGVTETKESAKAEIYRLGKGDFIWPVRGKIISSYGMKKGHIINKGIDIQAKEGTRIVAARAGRVSFCDERVRGFGKTIIIDHGDGYSTLYAHNSKTLVKVGQWVERGIVIAELGSTGRVSVPQLHFEIRMGHSPQNPLYYLPQ